MRKASKPTVGRIIIGGIIVIISLYFLIGTLGEML